MRKQSLNSDLLPFVSNSNPFFCPFAPNHSQDSFIRAQSPNLSAGTLALVAMAKASDYADLSDEAPSNGSISSSEDQAGAEVEDEEELEAVARTAGPEEDEGGEDDSQSTEDDEMLRRDKSDDDDDDDDEVLLGLGFDENV